MGSWYILYSFGIWYFMDLSSLGFLNGWEEMYATNVKEYIQEVVFFIGSLIFIF